MFFTEGLCIRKGLLSFVRKYNNLVISITPSIRKLPGRNKITDIKDKIDLSEKKKVKDSEKESVFWWLEW